MLASCIESPLIVKRSITRQTALHKPSVSKFQVSRIKAYTHPDSIVTIAWKFMARMPACTHCVDLGLLAWCIPNGQWVNSQLWLWEQRTSLTWAGRPAVSGLVRVIPVGYVQVTVIGQCTISCDSFGYLLPARPDVANTLSLHGGLDCVDSISLHGIHSRYFV